ncbi:glycogen/starch synthase, ADP-glucose type [Chloroherpeton thalassium ATCC 35110]|uniref:Glycogen synthase n=1 Tax=Chloroherpeton thalassium (strain ATCC 35110 / GB-78) TaxID=517418 RepID=B3QST3_CHLT3|nr:glycogen synthase GlgA [Chloroherpeton thalassium]ACF14130.1 glycogen/starch synthase, ADP-glucose type [Chloroherpeton thalassium ATCC 35110]
MPKKKLKVLFVSGEVVPFAKTGGLADVLGSLPQAVEDRSNEARIMMPKYGVINDRKFRLHDVLRLKEIPVQVDKQTEILSVKVTALPSSKIQTYFLYHEGYFKRNGLYVDAETKKDYPDNDERFIFFNRGVLETLKFLGWKPDIIHCNDWMSALIPAYLKLVYQDDPFFNDIKTIFTIHNLSYQGSFDKKALQKSGFPEDAFTPDGLEFYDRFNFMKIGLVYADVITTVSETYAAEICKDNELACGMKGILERRQKDIYGILSGIDESVWSPKKDELLSKTYTESDYKEGKAANKAALLEKYKLPQKEGVPMIGIISRLVDHKGVDLIIEAFDELIHSELQIVVLGSGEKEYEDFFLSAAQKYPDKIGVNISFDEELAHLIEGGSDMFLMPSRFEPCGMNQMYSLKYGTVPIVRATGGLSDTVKPFKDGEGNGFVFKKYAAADMMLAINEALKTFQDKGAWAKLIENGMSEDFSWKSSAEKYDELYVKLLEEEI